MDRFEITPQTGATCMYDITLNGELIGTADELNGTWTLYNLYGRQINTMDRTPDDMDLGELVI